MSIRHSLRLIGNIGKSPEVKHTEKTVIANFSIAENEKWKNKEGEPQEQTYWHNCTAFGKLAEIIEKYVDKGQLVEIDGKLRYSEWEDDKGNKRISAFIKVDSLEMLGGKKENSSTGNQKSESNNEPPAPGEDPDIPF